MNDRLALIDLATKAVLKVFPARLGRLDLPDGAGQVSPPAAGWTGGGVLTYRKALLNAKTGAEITRKPRNGQEVKIRDRAETGPDRYGIVAVTPGSIPTGHQRTSADPAFAYDADSATVVETLETEPIPAPPAPPTPTQKVERAVGVSLAELKALLEGV